MNFKPMDGRIVVKRQESDNQINGVLLPDSAIKNKNIGEVVAISAGKKLPSGDIVQHDVKVGDIIMFSPRNNHNEIDVDGQKYLVMVEADIIGIGYE
jgi:chaperonin GroES